MSSSLKARLIFGGLFLAILFILIFTGHADAGRWLRPKLGVYLEYPQSASSYLVSGKHVALGIDWSDVETTRGVWDWSYYDPRFNAVSSDDRLIIQIKNTPAWARPNGPNDPECVPPKSSAWGDFAAFVSMVIDRYDPWAVLIWNEPDATAWAPEYCGCFGPTYSDGQLYGSFVYAVYGVVKSYHPDVMIGVGETAGSNTTFTNGMYSTLGDHFDAATFHFYTGPGYNNLGILTNWVNYHRSKAQGKEIWLTETAYKCGIWPSQCGGTFDTDQAAYLSYLLLNNDKIHLITWYHLIDDGWAQVGMVDDGYKKPVYWTYYHYSGGWWVLYIPMVFK